MSIPKALWALVCRFIFTDSTKIFLQSDFMANIYFLGGTILLGALWRHWAWLRQLTELYTHYYHWVEVNVPLPGNMKLRRYMDRLNEAIIDLRGTPMTDKEIQRAKVAADALAAKDHMRVYHP